MSKSQAEPHVQAKSKSQSHNGAQPRISAFFRPSQSSSKKHDLTRLPATAHAPIDLTADDEDDGNAAEAEPAPKKRRVTRAESSTPPPAHIAAPSQWRYDPSSPSREKDDSGTSTAHQDSRRRRHEKFKRVLLGDDHLRWKPADGVEASTAQKETSADPGQSSEPENEAQDSDESDQAFKELTERFSHKQSKGGTRKPANGSGRSKGKQKLQELGPSGQPYTPSEKQVLKLINENPDTILMIEIGYKFYFHENSAKIASKELGIVAYPRRNLLTASIPVHRRDVHLKKLLSQGHKVGIVEQVETAALKKVSDTRNELFDRKLTHLYTATTFVDELESVDDASKHYAPSLFCLAEKCRQAGADDAVTVSVITICPSTGDVVWDEFDDSLMRIELETRLTHTRPAELLLPESGLSKPTEKLLKHFTDTAPSQQKIRVERFKELMSYTSAFDLVTNFYADKTKQNSTDVNADELLAIIADFPPQVVIALAHAIKHLSKFSIADAFLGAKFFYKFTTRMHMLLNSNTLTNLEIYRNETDLSVKGSLMWILDQTNTKFGARLLKTWVGRPLVDKVALQDRMDAVDEIVKSASDKLVSIRQVLRKMPDLAKGLCRIQYGTCTPQEMAILLKTFNKIATMFDHLPEEDSRQFDSKLLNDIVDVLPKLTASTKVLLGAVNLKAASQGKKDEMWADQDKFPALYENKLMIQTVESELADELKSVRKLLKKPALEWTSVSGEEFLVELRKSDKTEVPANWTIVSRTKYLTRYHSPEVRSKIQERARYRETLQAEAHKAFKSFLAEIIQDHYSILRHTVNTLATIDCLVSLSHVALREDYVRPEFSEDDTLEIVEGRHPMVEALRTDPFVPNDIYMGGDTARNKIITGPNMGGKSSSVRMVALIAIMAQIGSYVPAKKVKLCMLDGILTRMGASDELARGRSTFMVEMSETGEILQSATDKSLVILDELGRGTSTTDGMSIADAVLQHLVQKVRCKTLFITHYPMVAMDLERKFPAEIENLHMGYMAESRIDGRTEVTFLYRLTPGIATNSFGVECARLAGLSEDVLEVARQQSDACRDRIERCMRRNNIRTCARLISRCMQKSDVSKIAAIEELIARAEEI